MMRVLAGWRRRSRRNVYRALPGVPAAHRLYCGDHSARLGGWHS